VETKDKISVDQDALVDLAVYAWRLEVWLNDDATAASTGVPRYVLRGINKLLDQCNVSSLDMTGSEFDAGLALDVVDTIEMDSVQPGLSMIGETVAPIVNINGKVVRHGQVVLHVGPEKR
jgi:hypothetical protein